MLFTYQGKEWLPVPIGSSSNSCAASSFELFVSSCLHGNGLWLLNLEHRRMYWRAFILRPRELRRGSPFTQHATRRQGEPMWNTPTQTTNSSVRLYLTVHYTQSSRLSAFNVPHLFFSFFKPFLFLFSFILFLTQSGPGAFIMKVSWTDQKNSRC